MDTLTAEASLILREILTRRLSDIFAQNRIINYLNTADLLTFPNDFEGISSLKNATEIWRTMRADDRFFVLDRFNLLCNGFKCQKSIDQKTLVFWSIFIIELSVLLTKNYPNAVDS